MVLLVLLSGVPDGSHGTARCVPDYWNGLHGVAFAVLAEPHGGAPAGSQHPPNDLHGGSGGVLNYPHGNASCAPASDVIVEHTVLKLGLHSQDTKKFVTKF